MGIPEAKFPAGRTLAASKDAGNGMNCNESLHLLPMFLTVLQTC